MSEIRTLIVDDSSVMRKIVERSLRQAGLDPLVVLRGRQRRRRVGAVEGPSRWT